MHFRLLPIQVVRYLKRRMLQVVVGGLLVLVADVEEGCFIKMFAHQLQADG